MPTADQFPTFPPIRIELTKEQAADLERVKTPGSPIMIFGYARRLPWPDPDKLDPDKFTLVAWPVTMEDAEAALMAGGIMAKTRKRPRAKSKRGSPKVKV